LHPNIARRIINGTKNDYTVYKSIIAFSAHSSANSDLMLLLLSY